jgi:hypothetical protein
MEKKGGASESNSIQFDSIHRASPSIHPSWANLDGVPVCVHTRLSASSRQDLWIRTFSLVPGCVDGRGRGRAGIKGRAGQGRAGQGRARQGNGMGKW